MADLYVAPNDSAASNANTGLAGFPVREVQRAIDGAAAGDNIYVIGTTLGQPARLMALPDKDLKIAPVLGQGYMTAAQDISHGSIYEATLQRQIFKDDLQLFTGTGGTPGVYQTSVKLYGAGSAFLDSTSALSAIRRNTAYYGRKVRYRIVYTGIGLYTRVDDSTNNLGWNFGTQSWDVRTNYPTENVLPATASLVFNEHVTDWIDTEDNSSGFFYAQLGTGNGLGYVQEIHMEVMADWIDNSDGNFYTKFETGAGNYSNISTLSGRLPNAGLSSLFKGELTDYTNIRIVETDGSLPTAGDEGQSHYDSSAHRLYYRPSSGENILELHFEKLFGEAAISTTACDVTALGITFTCSEHALISNTSGTLISENCIDQASTVGGAVNKDASNITFLGGESRQPVKSSVNKEWGGGFVAGNGAGATGAMRVEGTKIIFPGDDALQNTGSAKLYADGVTSFYAQANDIEISADNAASETYIRNFSGYGAGQNSFRDQNSVAAGNHTVELINCSFHAGGAADMTWTTATLATLTVDTVYYGAATFSGSSPGIPAEITSNATPIVTPPFEDVENQNFTPIEGDVYQGTGSNWMVAAGVSGPPGADGEPIANIDTDVGGIQSTYGPFHPVNL